LKIHFDGFCGEMLLFPINLRILFEETMQHNSETKDEDWSENYDKRKSCRKAGHDRTAVHLTASK